MHNTQPTMPPPLPTVTLTIVVSSHRDRLPTLHSLKPSIDPSAPLIRPAAHTGCASYARKLLRRFTTMNFCKTFSLTCLLQCARGAGWRHMGACLSPRCLCLMQRRTFTSNTSNMYRRAVLSSAARVTRPIVWRYLATSTTTSATAATSNVGDHVNPSSPPTAIVMMNMGGPEKSDDVGPFLHRLFTDGEIIRLGKLQNTLGPFIARMRTPRIIKQYEAIGGSPILRWTRTQAEAFIPILDKLNPATAPHKAYVAFRYAQPLTEETLKLMAADGVTRAVAFSQYPQFSCTTSGSSLNHLWRESIRLGLDKAFTWSIIDRWPLHNKFIDAVADRIRSGLNKFDEAVRDKVLILFSAHSLPMLVVNRGDPYSVEVAATTAAVMQRLNIPNSHLLCWQSQVGFLPWLGPKTEDVIKGLAEQHHRYLLVVPVAFTSDHVETLYELDIEYGHVAKEAGIKQYVRTESLNASPLLAEAQAAIVSEHLTANVAATPQYKLNCPMCTNEWCRSILQPVVPYQKLRDHARAAHITAQSVAQVAGNVTAAG